MKQFRFAVVAMLGTLLLTGCGVPERLYYGSTPTLASKFDPPLDMGYLHQTPAADRVIALSVDANTQGGPAVSEPLRQKVAAALQAGGYSVVAPNAPHAIALDLNVEIFGHYTNDERLINATTSTDKVYVYGLLVGMTVQVGSRPPIKLRHGSSFTAMDLKFDAVADKLRDSTASDIAHAFGS